LFFTISKLKKQPFFAYNFKIQGGQGPLPPLMGTGTRSGGGGNAPGGGTFGKKKEQQMVFPE